MPETKPFLPQQIGKWLASDKPALREKAEAALRAAEPNANDLLLRRAKKERHNHFLLAIAAFFSWQFVYMFAKPISRHYLPLSHDYLSDVIATLVPIALTIPFALPLMFWATRQFVVPAGARYTAVLLQLAQRGDVRAVPLLLSSWLEPSPVSSDRLPEIEATLIKLTQNAALGTVPFSENPFTKDAAAPVRAKFTKMTRRENGAVFFTKSATLNARRIQVWLALLPHLAADPNPKNQVVLSGLLDAQAKTLEEEHLQNSVRLLLVPSTATEPAKMPAGTSTIREAWTPTEASERPTLLQRLGRR